MGNPPANLTEEEKTAAAEEANSLYREAQSLMEAEKYEEGLRDGKAGNGQVHRRRQRSLCHVAGSFDHPTQPRASDVQHGRR